MKGSLIIVGFFILGIVVGHADLAPALLRDSDVSFVALCGLLFCVGLGIGMNPDTKRDLRSINPRYALLPLVTILGSWLGAVVAWLMLYRGFADTMAINSGFAYYSLSSIFITEFRGVELGTIALLANIIREMITLLLAPLLAKVFGPLAPITAGGATSMDHPPHHHPHHRRPLHRPQHLPRLRGRFHRPLPRHHVVPPLIPHHTRKSPMNYS